MGFTPSPPEPLPLPATQLVDRVEVIAHIVATLRHPDRRVVSLIGPGGIGKTRLALQVGEEMQADFPDGVYYLALDSIRDAQSALARVAQLFGLSPDGYSSIGELLGQALQHRELLLILDNLEQVPAIASLLDDLLSSCRQLRLLLTSRELLHLREEHPFLVAPLPFPDPAASSSPEDLLGYPAVELFVQRARVIAPDLTMDRGSIDAIAQICARLDGLPLAIELAAARVRLLSPEALLERLEHRLAVLTGGGSERPARHQTLRATLDWSHELLSHEEQLVLHRLAIFTGGCDLEAAEAVCSAFGDLQTPVMDLLSSLIDKSLILSSLRAANIPRLSLSETVREYALEKLTQSGELPAAGNAHAEYYLFLAKQAGPALLWVQQADWLTKLDHDEQNFGAALSFLLSARDYTRAAQLVGELGRFWYVRGRLSEGLTWIEQVLCEGAAPRNRQALFFGGLFAIHLDQSERAGEWLRESFELSKVAGDSLGCARAAQMLVLYYLLKDNPAAAQAQADELAFLSNSGSDPWALASAQCTPGTLAMFTGDFALARTLFERSAELFREAGDLHLSELMSVLLADALLATGDRTRAQKLLDEHIHVMEKRQSAWTPGYLLCAHGRFALHHGDWSRARLVLERTLGLFVRLQDARGIARACSFLAQTALYQQDYTTAITMARRCLDTARVVDASATIISCLEELADVAVRRGKWVWAVQLWAAGERQRESAARRLCPTPPVERARLAESAREVLGEKRFSAAWSEGRALPLEHLLSVEHVASSMQKRSAKTYERPCGLTRREMDVLQLVARGLSNLEIAEQLVISPATVVSYLNVIYRKLDVSSRTAAMRYVIDHFLEAVEVTPVGG